MNTQQVTFTVIYFALGAGLILLSFLIIRDSARLRLNRITSAMLFLAGLGPIFAAMASVISPYQAGAPLKESYLYNLFYIWELFFPFLLYFSLIFPRDRIPAKKRRWLLLIFVPHLFHIVLLVFFSDTDKVLNLLTFGAGGSGLLDSTLDWVSSLLKWLLIPVGLLLASHKKFFSLINLLYVIMAVFYLYRGMRTVEAPSLRKQVRVLIAGMCIALGLYIFTFILPTLFSLEISGTITSLLTVLSLVIGAGSIAWAIIRYQFLDVRLIVRQSLVYTVSSALLVGLYVIAITQLSGALRSVIGSRTPLINIGLIIIVLILFQPINNQIDNIIKKMFIRGRADHRNIINRLSAQTIHILDRTQLLGVVEEALKENMLIEGIGFCVYDDAQQAYLFSSRGGALENKLSNTDPMLGAIGQLTAPTLYERVKAWRHGSPLATMLQAQNTHLIVPLRDREHLLGFMSLEDKLSGFKFNYEDVNLLSTLANHMVVALTNVRLYRESLVKQLLEEEMKLARNIQLDLLPKSPPCGDNFSLIAHNQPSRTVGGDFYDFVPMGDRSGSFGIVVADVSGKGMPAALLAAQIQAAIRGEAINRRIVSETITNVNNLIFGLSSSSGKFATLVYGEFDPRSGEFEFSNAGHNYPILVRADGACEFLETGGTILGAFEGNRYESRKVLLGQNDLIVFYTDGLSETLDEKDQEFGEKRLVDYIVQNRHCAPTEIKNGLLKQVDYFSGSKPPEDDTTIVILKVNGQSKNE